MRAFRIPAALLVVASLALLGCGDLGTGPSAEAPQFVIEVGPPRDSNEDDLSCIKGVSRPELIIIVDNNINPDRIPGEGECPQDFDREKL